MVCLSGVEGNLLQYLVDGGPMARSNFFHYGLLLLYAHVLWRARGFGKCLVKDVAASLCALNPDWAASTEWAEAQVCDEPSEQHFNYERAYSKSACSRNTFYAQVICHEKLYPMAMRTTFHQWTGSLTERVVCSELHQISGMTFCCSRGQRLISVSIVVVE